MPHPRPGAMPPPHPAGAATSPLLPMLVYLTVIVVAGVAGWRAADHDHGVPPGGDAQPLAAEEHVASDVPAEQDAPAPTGVRIGSLDIALETVPLGLEDDGSLEVPEDPFIAGWWTGGATPGERGPAVIAGHVDSRDGPGAFYGLEQIGEGERVSIDRDDGTGVHFRVERIERHPKDDFPTAAVYGETDAPTLRLVTCAGEFDPAARSYEDNVIVFLELEGWSEAS